MPGDTPPIRYAVVGLGWFAQIAVLPAFENARESSSLAALVSSDPEKLSVLGERYAVPEERRVGYGGYDELLRSGAVDAVYVATPNHLHRSYAVRAAEAGVHVLCEKPLAVTEEDCRAMIDAAEANGVLLMTAYRLHFEALSLRAVELARSGAIGEPRLFDALFSNPMDDPDSIRLGPIEKGGGTVYDIGVYCINAARSLFRSEPESVSAMSVSGASGADPRFRHCDETTAAVLRFPGGRLATFVSSFGGAGANHFRLVGTKGDLLAAPAFEVKADMTLRVTIGGETTEETFPARDQIAPELLHFSRSIREGRRPGPDGLEGLADVTVIRAIHESARRGGAPVAVEPTEGLTYADPSLGEHRPPRPDPELVNEEGP
jgi:predicted dehydrogenase